MAADLGEGLRVKVKDRTACMPPDLSCPCRRQAVKPLFEPHRSVTTAIAIYKADRSQNAPDTHIPTIKQRSEKGAKLKWRREKRREGSVSDDDLTHCPHGGN